MKRPVEFTTPALRDLAHAYVWYEARRRGLGAELLQALEEQLERIPEHPNHFPVVVRDARRALLKRFPYSIPFREEGGKIVVLGVLHTSRNPAILRRRVP
jgi:plasmid stabilization system protein ParE